MDIFLGVGMLSLVMRIGDAALSLACKALSFYKELMTYREAATSRKRKTG